MKYAIEIKECLTRTIIVEAEDVDAAIEKTKMAYDQNIIEVNYDNASVDVDVNDDTENYIDIFGEETIQEFEVDLN